MKAKLKSRLLGEQSILQQTQPGPASPSDYRTQDQGCFTEFFHKSLVEKWSRLIPKNWITEEATIKIALGQMPDLRSVCLSLYNIFGKFGETKSVLDSIPVLQGLSEWPKVNWDVIPQNTSNSHLLIDNKIMVSSNYFQQYVDLCGFVD